MNGVYKACEESGCHVYYTDTDSVWISKDKLDEVEEAYNACREDREMPSLIGEELCQFHNDLSGKDVDGWKPEYKECNIYAEAAFIVTRKVYLLLTAYVCPDGSIIRGQACKMKGMPKAAVEWYCRRLPQTVGLLDYHHLDTGSDYRRSLCLLYRDLLVGVNHMMPLNPTRATFTYDRASYVYTNTRLWYRNMSRKDHGLITYQGPVKNFYTKREPRKNNQKMKRCQE